MFEVEFLNTQISVITYLDDIFINLKQAITRNTTLLVDDDANNIRIAFENKVRAVRFDPKNIQV